MSGDVLDRNWFFLDTSLTRQTWEYLDNYKARNAVKNFNFSERLIFKLTVADPSACHLRAHDSRSFHQTITALRSGNKAW
jgi:predicted RNA-binding protein with PUA-like domain